MKNRDNLDTAVLFIIAGAAAVFPVALAFGFGSLAVACWPVAIVAAIVGEALAG